MGYKITKPTVSFEIPFDEFLDCYKVHQKGYATILSEKYSISHRRVLYIKKLYEENLAAMGAENPFVAFENDDVSANIYMHIGVYDLAISYCKENSTSFSALVEIAVERFNSDYFSFNAQYKFSPSIFYDYKSRRRIARFQINRKIYEGASRHIEDYKTFMPLLDISLGEYISLAVLAYLLPETAPKLNIKKLPQIQYSPAEKTLQRMLYIKPYTVKSLTNICKNYYISLNGFIDMVLAEYTKDITADASLPIPKYKSNEASTTKLNIALSADTFLKLKTLSHIEKKPYCDILDNALRNYFDNKRTDTLWRIK